jgi:hypothetical protein
VKGIALAAISCVTIILAGCGGGGGQFASSTPASITAAIGTSALPRTPVPAPANLSATDIVNGLKNAGLPIGQVQAYDASNDPNSLLGRPSQYTSKVNFADTRLPAASGLDVSGGGSVEVFGSVPDAQVRAKYLATVAQAAPGFLGEYDYLSGTILLRLAFKLTPDQAKQYATALAAITHQPAALATAVAAPPSASPR